MNRFQCLLSAISGLFLLMVPPELASPLAAETETLSGDHTSRVVVGGAELYQATPTFRVRVQQNVMGANTGVLVQSGPNNSIWRGGRITGTGINRTKPWDYVYHKVEPGNGACMLIENNRNFVVQDLFGEFCWDGIRPTENVPGWVLRGIWLRDIRDDAIENDHIFPGLVERSYIEQAHTLYSGTPGGGAGSRPHRIEWVDNLISLGCGLDGRAPCEDRAKRLDDATSNPLGNGQVFKVRGCGDEIDVLFRGNQVMLGASRDKQGWYNVGFNTSGSNLPFFQCMHVDPASTGNTIYWLGARPSGQCQGGKAAGWTFTELHGACVPANLKLDPKVFTKASNSKDAWLAVEQNWIENVYKGPLPTDQPPPPPPVCEPATDTDLDGIRDCADNCPTVANPGQEDIDGDEVGNVCEGDEPLPPPPPPTDVDAALQSMDEAVAGLRVGTDILMSELPAGNLSRAARNTGAGNADKLAASVADLRRLVGQRMAFDAMESLASAMQARSAAVKTALEAGDGAAAHAQVRPELTAEIEGAVPAVRSAASEDGSLPPPPPPPPDYGWVRERAAEIRESVQEALDGLDALDEELIDE